MYRDVIATLSNGDELTIRVEDPNVREISDVVAMRLAYEYAYGDAANDVVVGRACRIVPPPACIIGLDGKRIEHRRFYILPPLGKRFEDM
jgi:hypothetical protein